MDIRVVKENLQNTDTGGGFRELSAMVTIDNSVPIRRQREAVIYEILALFFEPTYSREFIEDTVTKALIDGLDEVCPHVSKAGYTYPEAWQDGTYQEA